MNRQELIALSVECGIGDPDLSDDESVVGDYADITDAVLRFAESVAAHEREACAKVCDEWNARHGAEYGNVAAVLARIIRNRSNAELKGRSDSEGRA